MMDFQQIQELIKLVNKSKLTHFKMKEGDFELVIKAGHDDDHTNGHSPAIVYPAAPQVMMQTAPAAPAPTPAPAAPSAPAAAAPAAAPAANGNTKEIKSPMVGTFYRSAGPGKPEFVKIGDSITKGQTICIIEAMKLFNELESDIDGKIVKILIEDGKPVEYDQPLFLVEV